MLRAFAICLTLIALLSGTALAHKIMFTAWVEDGVIVSETAFGDGSAGDGATVTVFDAATGQEILQGVADDDGIFESPLPADVLQRAPDLRVVTNAGAGHQTETVVPGADYAQVAATEETPAPASDDDAATVQGIDPAQLQVLIRKEVEAAVRKEVQPLKREILALRDAGPGPTEILGGIGYILGLAGLAMLMKYRKGGA